MRLFLHPNGTTPDRRETAFQAVETLSRQFDCVIAPENASWLDISACKSGGPEDCDMICAIGGDGTILHAAIPALRAGKPLFGINMGHRGYLCAFNRDELPALDEQRLSALVPSPRTLLGFSWHGEEHFAVNDIIIAKGEFGTTVTVSAQEGKNTLGQWQGDGIVVATPTGSSGYNASAGGPLLTPDCGCFVLNPLCPVEHNGNAIIYPDVQFLSLRAKTRDNQPDAQVYADGTLLGPLKHVLNLHRYEKTLTLLIRA